LPYFVHLYLHFRFLPSFPTRRSSDLFTLFAVLGFCLAVPSLVMAQSEYNHAEVGVFADYFRFSTPNPNINFVGVGGRIAANVHPNIQLEAEMNYDFRRNVTNKFDNGLSTSLV